MYGIVLAVNDEGVSVSAVYVLTPEPEPPLSSAHIRFPLASVVITPPFNSPVQSSVPIERPPPATERPLFTVLVAPLMVSVPSKIVLFETNNSEVVAVPVTANVVLVAFVIVASDKVVFPTTVNVPSNCATLLT